MHIWKVALGVSLLMTLAGCERVIDLDLNEAHPAIVIEADLSSTDGILIVTVSSTSSYFDSEPHKKISGAIVHLENEQGRQIRVPEEGRGYYLLSEVQATPGDSFRLKVEVDGIIYTAQTTIEAPVDIDSIGYHYYTGDDFFREGYRFNLAFHDPPGERNYYRIRVYQNGHLFNRPTDLVVFDDSDLDGSVINVRLHSQYYLEKGETVLLELMSIDRTAWEYFTTLSEVINEAPGSPAPANPVSTFTNGALGYFYGWSCSRKRVMIMN